MKGRRAAFLLQLPVYLFNALMQMVRRAYCLKLWRRETGWVS